jgi:sterol desaturase/sphingolipid hydroxylase (fatty acid hydroxylase superfamily)
MSVLLLGSAAVLWLAHRHKHPAGVSAADREDPLPWTGLQVFAIVPSLLVLGKLAGLAPWVEALWLRSAALPPSQLIRRALYFQISLYLSVGLAFLALDLAKKPGFLYKHKLQRQAQVDYAKSLPRLFAVLAMNVLLPVIADLTVPSAYLTLADGFVDAHLPAFVKTTKDLPSVWQVTLTTWGFLLCYDVLFFYSHWALHTPAMYARVHKLHHEWKSPTALAAAYAHPVEHVISNLLPAGVAVVLFRPHILAFSVFTSLGLLITLFEHSGYELVDTAAFHNLHHQRFRDNYGLLGTFDAFHGTRTMPKLHAEAGDVREAVVVNEARGSTGNQAQTTVLKTPGLEKTVSPQNLGRKRVRSR